MTQAATDFFAAWAEADSDRRKAMIAAALTDDATYSDPRSGDRLAGIDAIADYVGGFSANAPGWSAKVTQTDMVNGYLRLSVVFGGPGPDGKDIAQSGTYFAETGTDEKLRYLAGFVG